MNLCLQDDDKEEEEEEGKEENFLILIFHCIFVIVFSSLREIFSSVSLLFRDYINSQLYLWLPIIIFVSLLVICLCVMYTYMSLFSL